MSPDAKRPEAILRGILLRIGAALSISLMSALFKLASTRGVTAPEMIFYRSIGALLIVLAWVGAGPGLASLKTTRPLAHLWRSVIGNFGMLLMLQALVLLPLAELTTISFTSPVFATILSWLLLHEKVGRHRWGAVLVGFIGVVVVLRPGQSGQSIDPVGVGFGLAAALNTAVVTITLRNMQEHPAAVVFWFMIASMVVGLCALPFFGQLHGPVTLAILLAGGLVGGVLQLLMTASLSDAPVAVVMPFDYFQLFGALLLGWLLFATVPTANTIGGAGLIISAGLYTAWRERRRHLQRASVSAAGVEPV